jgi:hypothetical protein
MQDLNNDVEIDDGTVEHHSDDLVTHTIWSHVRTLVIIYHYRKLNSQIIIRLNSMWLFHQFKLY